MRFSEAVDDAVNRVQKKVERFWDWMETPEHQFPTQPLPKPDPAAVAQKIARAIARMEALNERREVRGDVGEGQPH
jgi:hypothetical protein